MKYLESIRIKAENEGVPIMPVESIKYIIDLFKEADVQSVLEVGSAVGYSSSMFALNIPSLSIDTIERDMVRSTQAKSLLIELSLQERVRLFEMDAFDFRPDRFYDCVLIDAAKAQNESFFKLFGPFSQGLILIDNIDFHGFVDQPLETIESRNLRAMVRKVKKFKDFLDKHPLFDVEYVSIGDGLAIVRRR